MKQQLGEFVRGLFFGLLVVAGIIGYTGVTEDTHRALARHRVRPGAAEYMQNEEGLFLRVYRWNATTATDATATTAVAFIAPGARYGCSHYNVFAESLRAAGIDVVCVDWQGFGESEGDRGYVKHFGRLSRDFQQAVITLREARHGKVFCVGASMGGVAVLEAVLRNRTLCDGVALLAPALEEKFLSPTVDKLVQWASRHTPKLPISITDGTWMRVRTGATLLAAIGQVRRQSRRLWTPTIAFHGTKDDVVDQDATMSFVERGGTDDRVFVDIPDAGHNDLRTNPTVLSRLIPWLKKHL
jgi:alpha-beta hydrolase superfamily lysophospholipase